MKKTIIIYGLLWTTLGLSAYFIEELKELYPQIRWLYITLFAVLGISFFLIDYSKISIFIHSCLFLSLSLHFLFIVRYQNEVSHSLKLFPKDLKRLSIKANVHEIYGFNKRNQFQIKVHLINISTLERRYSFDHRVYAYISSPVSLEDTQIGDVILLDAYASLYRDIRNPSYKNYLFHQKILGTFYIYNESQITLVKRNSNIFSFTMLKEKLKNRLEIRSSYLAIYGFSKGLLLGDRTQIPKEIDEYFKKTGIAHFLAISGLHVGILLLISFSFLRLFLSFSKAKQVTLFVILPFYLILLSFNPPIFRVFIMGVLGYYLYLRGKTGKDNQYQSFFIWSISLMICAIIEPNNLFTLSFQLSFSATLGILFFLNIFDFHRNYPIIPRYLIDFFLISLGAQLFVLPFILGSFGYVSPYFLVYNFLIYPFILLFLVYSVLLLISPLWLSFIWENILKLLYYLMYHTLNSFSPHYTWEYSLENPHSPFLLFFLLCGVFSAILWKKRIKELKN